MKNRLTYASFIICLFVFFKLTAQTPLSNPSACGLGLPITDNNCPENGAFYNPNEFRINVNNAPGSRLGVDVYLKEVRLIINHPWAGDLDLSLVSPSGKAIRLSFDNGGGNDNYGMLGNCNYMTFSLAACQSIEDGIAPFLDGIYTPEESFLLLNDNTTDPNGQWRLRICDDVADDEGTLEFVNLVFESTSCFPITDVDILNVDTTRVRLDWTPDDCSPVIVEYGPPGFTPGTDQNAGQGTLAFANSCAPYNLTGLQPDTEYEIYIRRRCVISSTFSENSCSVTVRTGCLPPPQTIVERFDTYANCGTTCGAVCDFPGIFRNVSVEDDFDWVVNSGRTPTVGSGPDGDVNGGSGKYVYLEASGTACTNGKQTFLLSNCIRIDKQSADTCHVSFNYHMFGTNIGTLRFQASANGGATWTTMWEKSGDQGDEWRKVYLSLNQFADDQIVRFRFVGIGGNGPKGDIAIDNIVFFGSEDLGFPDMPFYADADGDGYGNPNVFITSCANDIPPGYTLQGGDCNDMNPNINPGAPEISCDGIDNNCNGMEDENSLPAPIVVGDTICSGGSAVVCATPTAGRPIFWYDSAEGGNIVGVGTCFFPTLPLNNSPVPVVYRFYAEESDFVCKSDIRSEVLVIVNPNPNVNHTDMPEVCPGESFDLASLNIEDENFTGAAITFHAASPANAMNELTNTLVTPNATTTYYYLATTPDGCIDEQSVTVFAKPAPNLTFTPSDAFSLCLENSAQISVSAAGGGGNYSYLWSTGETDTDIDVQASTLMGNVDKYFITVTDGGNCSSVDSVAVTSTNSIDSVRVSSQNVSSCIGNDGRITVTPLSGQAPYSYAWSSANGISGSANAINGAFTINNLEQGAYRITVTDSSPQACAFFLRQVLVNGPAAMVNNINIQNVDCADTANGSITLNVVGVNPQYFWSTGATTSSIQNLSGGTYSVTITEGACETILEDLVVTEPLALKAIPNITEPTCAENNDGQISLSVFGGRGNYSYLWNTGSRRNDINNLRGGSYSVTITDQNNCTLVENIELPSPDTLKIAMDSLRVISCFGGEDGYIRVRASGGTPPYRYQWNTGSTAPVLPNLSAGDYTVTVTDFKGCARVQTIPITQPNFLQLRIVDQINPTCIGDETGSLNAEAIGGTLPYNFSWNTSENTADIANLGVGTYNVTLTDANGCAGGERSATLTATSPIDVTVAVTEPECIGRTDGRIDVNPIGSGPFSFTWDRGDVSQNIENVGIGTYTVTVEDGGGCLFDTTITVEAPQAFDLNIGVFQPSCFQTLDGSINVNFFSAGTPPVDFQWSNGSTSQDLINIGAGDYVLSLTDSRGCAFTSDTIVIENPPPLALQLETLGQIVCKDDSTGFIEVATSGGTQPYNFDWVGTGMTTEDIFGLPGGEYRLVVKDANECPIDTSFRLTEPAQLLTEIQLKFSDECDANFSNEVKAITKGGVGPYRYTWSNGASDSVLTNVTPGDYQLVIQDANGCIENISSIKVRDAGKALTIDTFIVKDVKCFGADDGEMLVKVSGGAAPFRFHFSNNEIYTMSAREASVQGLAPDSDYSVTITDMSTGCVIASEKKKIKEPQELSYIFDRVNEPNCFSSSDGAIFASTYGGTQPYTYEWYNGSGLKTGMQEDLMNAPNNQYIGYVTDANGCRDSTIEVNLLNDNELIRFAPNTPMVRPVTCRGDRDGAINITLLGGAPPYEYRWSNNRNTEDIANLAAGAYTLTVTDADTCRVIFPAIVVRQPASEVKIEGKVNDILCFGESNGSIEIQATGGTSPYNYIWEYRGSIFTSDTTALTNLTAGNYTVTVRDTNQCQQIANFSVIEPPELLATLNIGAGNIVKANVTGGVPNYEYLWNTGETTPEIMIDSVGTYTVTITDANNCEVIASDLLNSTNVVQFVNRVRVFPNPSSGEMTLEINLQRTLDIRFEIWNAIGQRIAMQELGDTQQIQLPIDLSQSSGGIYWINVFAEGQSILSEAIQIIR